MGTKKAGDGVPPGMYQVHIVEAMVPGEQFARKDSESGEMIVPLILAIDPKYTNSAQSGLTCEVKGSMKHKITVAKPPAGFDPFATEDTGPRVFAD